MIIDNMSLLFKLPTKTLGRDVFWECKHEQVRALPYSSVLYRSRIDPQISVFHGIRVIKMVNEWETVSCQNTGRPNLYATVNNK